MKKATLAFIFLLIIILFGIYWKTFNYELIWDDEAFFKLNVLFIEDHPLVSAFKFGYFSEQLGVRGQDHYYRPLLTLSFLLENKLWGIHGVTLRMTNLLIFILSLILLYSFLKSQSDKGYFPEIATLLFALYPSNIENIVWVVGRGDLLLLLWGVLTFFFLGLFIKKRNPFFLVCSSLFYLLGMFSKEAFLLFFPILIIYELVKRKKISWIYHLANLAFTLLFFFLKNVVLGIKSFGLAYSPLSLESLRAIFGTAGYYFRTIIFPFSYSFFVQLSEVRTFFYVGFGLLALIFIVFLLVQSKKNSDFRLPSLLFIFFLIGHVPLIFTNIFPYQIYSRYMMIAVLGFVWIVATYLVRLQEKTRFTVVLILIIFFIPSLVLNANSYKNKEAFWQRALKLSQRDPFVFYQAANTAYENRDYLSAELFLNGSLALSMKRETAIMISLLYAEIELARADYGNAFRWLGSVEEFEKDPKIKIAPFVKYQINAKKARALASQSDLSSAEKLLQENMAAYGTVKEAYSELYGLYSGFEQWEKAAALEKIMKDIFPKTFAPVDTAKVEQEFDACSVEKKINFYIQNRNYAAAGALVKAMPAPNLDLRFLLAKLFYYQGQAGEGEKIVQGILEENPQNWETLGKIGYFYLSNLIRVREALFYFEKSLNLNQAQPEIVQVSNRLRNNYLARLKDPWKQKLP